MELQDEENGGKRGAMEEQLIKGVWTLATIAIGFIAFYLKKTDKKVDETEKQVAEVKQCYVTRAELEKVEATLSKKIEAQNSTIMTKLEKIEDKISNVSKENISKSDFVTTIARIDDKMDKVLDLIMEIGKK